MEVHTQLNNEQHKSIQKYEMSAHSKIDFSTLDEKFRREFINALNKGALSRCENLISILDEGACREWLAEQLSKMDFETIRSSIISA